MKDGTEAVASGFAKLDVQDFQAKKNRRGERNRRKGDRRIPYSGVKPQRLNSSVAICIADFPNSEVPLSLSALDFVCEI